MIKDDDEFKLELGTMKEDSSTFSGVVSMPGFVEEKDALQSAKFLFNIIMKDVGKFIEKNEKAKNKKKEGKMIDVNKVYKCGYGVTKKEDGSYVAMVLMESFDTVKDALLEPTVWFEKSREQR